jgi:hypothetical protein
MIWAYDGKYYESLTLAMARAALGVAKVVPGYPSDSRAGTRYSEMEWLEVADR